MNMSRLKLPLVAALAALVLLSTLWAAEEAPKIRLNTIGFLPDKEKKASIAAPCSGFAVVRAKDGAKVLEGTVGSSYLNPDTEEKLQVADFSALREPGEYQLDVPGVGRSAPFRVAASVYNEPFYVVTRGMYLWRCGTAVKAIYHGQTFEHGPCHLDDAWMDLITGEHVKVESTKGWHDAGDYNKYVINAGVTVGCMFRAWEDFPALRKVKLDLPESGGPLPDFLAEIKWETDWLLTMQLPDGAVSHKVSTKNFGGFILPERETADRFFVPWASAATADFVAMMAETARDLRPYDAAYADRCLAAARESYAFLQAHPQNHNAEMKGVTTGAYETTDWDDRLWAAAELWETTGDAAVLKDLETRIAGPDAQGRVDDNFDWDNVKNLGLITYVLSSRPGRNEELVAKIRASFVATADGIVQTAAGHGYGRPFGTRYYWGCNGGVARQSLVLMTAHRLSPKSAYVETTLAALNHLFGRNYYGRSFVTGLGFRPPMFPHDRRSAGDNVVEPWPGYLVGGSNPGATHWQDLQEDYRTNEIAINWNGALIYALAAFVDGSGQ
jgi:endoglucanase